MTDIERVLNAGPRSSRSEDRAAIGKPPYLDADPDWPTYGYDGGMCYVSPHSDEEPKYTRVEWLALAVEMESRWKAWAEWCRNAPSEYFKGGPPDGE